MKHGSSRQQCWESECRDSFELRYRRPGIGGDVRNADSGVSAVLDLFSNCKIAQTKREIYYDSFIYMANSFHLPCTPKDQSAQTGLNLAPTGQQALH